MTFCGKCNRDYGHVSSKGNKFPCCLNIGNELLGVFFNMCLKVTKSHTFF